MLSAYIDDSGTHTDSEFVVMAYVIGSDNQWTSFERAWKAQLQEPIPGKPPLRKFHMTDCATHHGEFQAYSDPEVDLVTKAFRDIILRAGVHGRAIGVPRREWDRLIVGLPRFFFGTVEELCTRFCIYAAVDWAIDNSDDVQISLVFDDGPQHISRSQRISENIKSAYDRAKGRAELFGPSFLPVEKFVPLQASDMLAWESYAYGCEWINDNEKKVRPHFKHLFESNRFDALFMNTGNIEDLVKPFRRPPG
jgi:hypothetical protein